MPDGENYRKKALDCMLAAESARDPGARLILLNLARNYVALADYLDTHRTAQDRQKDS
jgi:hypothetical protein